MITISSFSTLYNLFITSFFKLLLTKVVPPNHISLSTVSS